MVRFRNSPERIVYDVLATGIGELFEGRYVEHWLITALGLVPAELLEPTVPQADDTHAVDLDLHLYLTKGIV